MADPALRTLLEQQQARFYGKYRGVVTDNRDTDGLGRVTVKVPQVLGDTEVLALPCVPYAGKSVGFFAMPKKGTGVWVEFEAGDPSNPIWSGCVWAEGDIDRRDAVPEVKFLKTEKFTLRIDDSAGEILIQDANGSEIAIGPIGITIKGPIIETKSTGGRSVRVDSASVNVNNAFVVS